MFLALSLMRPTACSTRASYLLPYSCPSLFFLTPRRVARSPLPLPYELYPARQKAHLHSCSHNWSTPCSGTVARSGIPDLLVVAELMSPLLSPSADPSALIALRHACGMRALRAVVIYVISSTCGKSVCLDKHGFQSINQSIFYSRTLK